MFDESENQPAILLTPLVDITETSCLSIQASLVGLDLSIKVYPLYLNHTKGEIITVIGSVSIHNCSPPILNTELPRGTYNLMVEAYGSRAMLNVSEVKLISGECVSLGEGVILVLKYRVLP